MFAVYVRIGVSAIFSVSMRQNESTDIDVGMRVLVVAAAT